MICILNFRYLKHGPQKDGPNDTFLSHLDGGGGGEMIHVVRVSKYMQQESRVVSVYRDASTSLRVDTTMILALNKDYKDSSTSPNRQGSFGGLCFERALQN